MSVERYSCHQRRKKENISSHEPWQCHTQGPVATALALTARAFTHVQGHNCNKKRIHFSNNLDNISICSNEGLSIEQGIITLVFLLFST